MSVATEKFKNLTDGIKNIAIVFAVLVGGGWALFEFLALQRAERASVEINSLKQEIERSSVLQIDIDAKQEQLLSYEGRYITGTVTIRNLGSRTASLDLSTEVVSASRVKISDKGEVLFGQKYGYAIQDQDGHLSIEGILAGKYREYPFLIRVGPPGLYSVTFIAKSPRKEVADVGAMEFKDQVTWAAQVFVKVK